MPDWFSDNAPSTSSASSADDWFASNAPKPRAELPTRPVSAEDFAPPAQSRGWPAKLADIVSGGAKALYGGAKGAAALAYHGTVEPLLHPLRDPRESPLMEDLRGIGGAQIEQFRKAAAAPTVSEAIGHTTAGVLPLVGPAAAQAGEKIGAGDYEGVGEALALTGAPFVGKAVPLAGRAAGATGRGVKAGVKAAGPLALAGAELIPGVSGVVRGVRAAGRLAEVLEDVLGKRAEPPSANAGGRVVPAAARSAEADIAAMLDEVAQPTPTPPPARITTPPQPDLMPGYTPRTTAPKPKPAKAELPAAHPLAKPPKPKADATMGPKGYFLREPPAARAASAPLSIEDFPASTRAYTGQPMARVTKAEIEQAANELAASGHSIAEVMDDVTRAKNMHPQTRLKLMAALGKIAKRKR